MFLRIAITNTDEDSHQRQGIFVASHGLLDSGDLTNAEAGDLRSLLEWFNRNLPRPSKSQRQTLSRRAIFWFRPGAHAFLPKAWELTQLLRSHGFLVDVLKTRTPGYIVFSDEWQVAAVPFKNKG